MSDHTCPAGNKVCDKRRLRDSHGHLSWPCSIHSEMLPHHADADGTPCGDGCTIRALKEENKELLNLLAIIHRDGGHHTEEVGIKQSINDAHKVWAGLRENDYNLQAQVGVLVEGIEELMVVILDDFGKSSSWYWRLKKLVDNLPEAARKHREYVEGLEEVLEDKRRLARKIDVAMFGEKGAAEQPGFADVLKSVEQMKAENTRLREENEKLKITASWANYD